MPKHFQKKRRFFLLIEVLIALWLAMLCLFALIKPHIAFRFSEREYITRMQLESLAQQAFIDLKIDLFENTSLTFSQLKKGIHGELSKEYRYENFPPYHCTYSIEETKDDTKKKRKNYVCLTAHLSFYPAHALSTPSGTFSYDFVVGRRQ